MKPGLASVIRSCRPMREVYSPHVRQTARSSEPCSSMTSVAPDGLVQAVDVLGDDRPDVAGPLQVGDDAVALVGLGGVEALPADVAAGPVAPTRLARPGELAVRHRLDAARAVGPAVVGDARLGREARAAEHDDAAAADEVDEVVERAEVVRLERQGARGRQARSSPRAGYAGRLLHPVSLRAAPGPCPAPTDPADSIIIGYARGHDRCCRPAGHEGHRRRGKLHERRQRARLHPAGHLADGPPPRAAHRHRPRRALRPPGPPHRGRAGARPPRRRRARRPRRRRGGDHRDRRPARRTGPAPGLPQLVGDARAQGRSPSSRPRHPDITVTFTEAEPPESLAALRNGDCDVAVAFAYEGADLGELEEDLSLLVTRRLWTTRCASSSRSTHPHAGDAARLARRLLRRGVDRRLSPLSRPPALPRRPRGLPAQRRLRDRGLRRPARPRHRRPRGRPRARPHPQRRQARRGRDPAALAPRRAARSSP